MRVSTLAVALGLTASSSAGVLKRGTQGTLQVTSAGSTTPKKYGSSSSSSEESSLNAIMTGETEPKYHHHKHKHEWGTSTAAELEGSWWLQDVATKASGSKYNKNYKDITPVVKVSESSGQESVSGSTKPYHHKQKASSLSAAVDADGELIAGTTTTTKPKHHHKHKTSTLSAANEVDGELLTASTSTGTKKPYHKNKASLVSAADADEELIAGTTTTTKPYHHKNKAAAVAAANQLAGSRLLTSTTGTKPYTHKKNKAASVAAEEAELEGATTGTTGGYKKTKTSAAEEADLEGESTETTGGYKKTKTSAAEELEAELAEAETTTGKTKKKTKTTKVGAEAENPLYVDIQTDAILDIALFPDNLYLTSAETKTLGKLLASIIYAQEAMLTIAPSIAKEIEYSIELWVGIKELVPNYRIIKQIQYINALDALKKVLHALEKCKEKEAKELDALLKKLLIDNLFLAGFLNDVYENTVVPTYLIERPGDVIGALLHFIGIDVTKGLNYWPLIASHSHL